MANDATEIEDVELARELDEEPLESGPETVDAQISSDSLIFDTMASRCPPG